jgi:hypothetical protein
VPLTAPLYGVERSPTHSDQEAHEAAVAAVQEAWPLPWKEASAEGVNAIVCARAGPKERKGAGGLT